MPGPLYGRRAVVVVGTIGDDPSNLEAYRSATGIKFDSGTDREPGLRIALETEQSARSSLNQATVKIWNLSEDSRSRIREYRSAFGVWAGYGTDVAQVFSGNVTRTWTERDGPDLVTVVESADGYDAVQKARVVRTWPRGTALVELIVDTINAFGLPVSDLTATLGPVLAAAAAAGRSPVTKRAHSADASAAEVLDSLARAYQFEWMIQDGVVHIVPRDLPLPGVPVLLSPSTGLVGLPSKLMQSVNEAGEAQGIDGAHFRFLLVPAVKPGVLVGLTSEAVTGAFRVERVRFTADTREGPFEGEADAKQLPGVGL